MSLVLGQRMVRLEDGTRGVVALVDGERRITWDDRGETRVAGKMEEWQPDAVGARKLRPEEMRFVARWADGALEAIEKHEPFRYWETVRIEHPSHDQALVDLIVGYLEKK